MKKAIKRFAVTVLLYFGYCWIRGIIYGAKTGHKLNEETAYKIATFRS